MKFNTLLLLVLGTLSGVFGVVSQTQAQQNDPKKAAIEALSREEKNTMTTCPLHSKRMSLSDNYRANASDFRQSADYPFAYQLNYRRYCKICTKTLTKEVKSFSKEESSRGNRATMDRCTVHNEFMKTNPEFSSVNSVPDRDREKDMPNAKQYRGRLYCKTCSKIHSIRKKAKAKEDKE